MWTLICEQKRPEQPGRPSLAFAVGFAVTRSAFYVGLALSSIAQDTISLSEQALVKSSTLTAICSGCGSAQVVGDGVPVTRSSTEKPVGERAD